VKLRWRNLGCSAALAWIAACHAGCGAPAAAPPGADHEQRSARAASAAAKPAARSAPVKVPAAHAPAAARPAAVPRPGRTLSGALREVSLAPGALLEALSAMPETRDLAVNFRPFSEQALSRALAAQRAQQGTAGVQVARAALLWSAPRHEALLVLSGDTPQGAMLLAYAPRASGPPHFAGSYQTRGEHAPIMLGARGSASEELLFSTCWACGGEGGALRFDSGGRPRVVPR
jgi:hypothetical protein